MRQIDSVRDALWEYCSELLQTYTPLRYAPREAGDCEECDDLSDEDVPQCIIGRVRASAESEAAVAQSVSIWDSIRFE